MTTKKIFASLGVQVIDREVRTLSFGKGKPLGSLAGAQADVSEAGSVKAGRALMHTALACLARLYMGRRSSYAYITFAGSGTLHKTEIRGKSAWRTAQQQALEFNLLAGNPLR